jgi:glycosyltransferase involved in cell wall biosynthesis
VPPRDPRALAAALRELLGAPARRAELGHAGRRRAQRRFGWDRIAASTRAVYEDVASVAVPAASRRFKR